MVTGTEEGAALGSQSVAYTVCAASWWPRCNSGPVARRWSTSTAGWPRAWFTADDLGILAAITNQ